MQTKAYSAPDAKSPLTPTTIERRATGVKDVAIDVLYCGICHSDIHQARNEWQNTQYPCVPGHEIVGRVSEVGGSVTKFKTGDLVGIGCIVDSCRTCRSCSEGQENYCEAPTGFTGTYNGPMFGGDNTFGGYSKYIVVDQDYVLRIPETLDAKAVAPLLCAGITMYSPLKFWGVDAQTRVGIVGLGGLGHMAVKLAAAMGAKVTVITTSAEKAQDAARLGATNVLVSKDVQAMAENQGKFDFILSTVPQGHDAEPYMGLLDRDGVLVFVGCAEPLSKSPNIAHLILRRRSLAGSVIGGIAETQEMLDFCAQHNIVSDIEMIDIAAVNDAYERTIKGDVKYRFVIDMASL